MIRDSGGTKKLKIGDRVSNIYDEFRKGIIIRKPDGIFDKSVFEVQWDDGDILLYYEDCLIFDEPILPKDKYKFLFKDA